MTRRLDWIYATIRINWANVTANMNAFWTMAGLMAVQNLIFFSLWGVIFSRISSLHGWKLPELAFLYACGGFGYGILFSLMGGLNQLSSYIHEGMMDVYLARPRPVLLSVLLHRMRSDGLGDIIACLLMIVFIVRPELKDLPLIIFLSMLAGIVYVSFCLIVQSCAFWGLDSEASENAFISFIIASSNPQKGFGVWGKFLLLTVFPAGYIGLLPVEILKEFSWKLMAWQIIGTMIVFAFALWFFHLGLRRYASGNKFLALR